MTQSNSRISSFHGSSPTTFFLPKCFFTEFHFQWQNNTKISLRKYFSQILSASQTFNNLEKSSAERSETRNRANNVCDKLNTTRPSPSLIKTQIKSELSQVLLAFSLFRSQVFLLRSRSRELFICAESFSGFKDENFCLENPELSISQAHWWFDFYDALTTMANIGVAVYAKFPKFFSQQCFHKHINLPFHKTQKSKLHWKIPSATFEFIFKPSTATGLTTSRLCELCLGDGEEGKQQICKQGLGLLSLSLELHTFFSCCC